MPHRTMHRKMNQAASAVQNLQDTAQRKLQYLKGGMKITRKAARSVQRYSQKHPYMVVGAFSLIAGFLGYVFGVRRNYYY